jgi:hypothetical protein
MTDLIVNELKKGAWKNVVPFGYLLPPAPYIVVKEEPTELGYTRWRFIGHIAPGNKTSGIQPDIMSLRTYMRKTLYDLINGKILQGGGRAVMLERIPGQKHDGLSIQNDDGTISIETTYRQTACP